MLSLQITILSLLIAISYCTIYKGTLTLNPSEQVPPCTTTGSGRKSSSTVFYDDITNILTYSIGFRYPDFADPSVHIHHGAAGQNGDVKIYIDLSSSTDPGRVRGSTVISSEDGTELLNDQFYVDVHSTNCPDGQVRGQIILSAVTSSPTAKTWSPTAYTLSPTAKTWSPSTSPTHDTSSPTPYTLSPSTSPTHDTSSPTHDTSSPTHDTSSPTPYTLSPTAYTLSPTAKTWSPSTSSTHDTSSPTDTPSDDSNESSSNSDSSDGMEVQSGYNSINNMEQSENVSHVGNNVLLDVNVWNVFGFLALIEICIICCWYAKSKR